MLFRSQPADITVTLLNEKGEPLRAWNVVHAVPKKWLVSDFNANENSLAIETMEMIAKEVFPRVRQAL